MEITELKTPEKPVIEYEQINRLGRELVITEKKRKDSRFRDANFMGSRKALSGILNPGETVEEFGQRRQRLLEKYEVINEKLIEQYEIEHNLEKKRGRKPY